MLLGVTVSLFAWRASKDEVDRLVASRFDARVAELQTVLEQRMVAYPQVLRGIQAMVSASGHPSRADWARVNQTLQVDSIYPGLTGTVYIRSVPGEQRTEFEREVLGFEPGFQIKPPGERPYYTIVTSVEPRTPSNLPVIGSDSWVHPVRRATLEAARDSGAIQITGKLNLVIDDKPTPAFLMYQAIYQGAAIPDTIEERRDRLLGFATAGCRVGVLMRTILPADLNDVEVRVYDGAEATADGLYFDSHPDVDVSFASHQAQRAVQIGGRTWTVIYAMLPGFAQAAEGALPRQTLVGGILVSLLLTLIVWSLATTRARAQALAVDMTHSLRASEGRFRELAENIDQVFFVADPQYRHFDYISPSFERIWGRSRQELLENPDRWLSWLHPEDVEAVRAVVAAHGGEDDYGTKFRIVRADGEVRWLAAHAFNVARAADEPARVVGFHSDITDQKAAEEKIARYISEIEVSNNDLEQFAYVASHDLREPLRMVSSYLTLLERRYGELLDADGREFLDFAREGAVRLDRLVLDLLGFSRIQRHGNPLAATNLAHVMGDVLRNLTVAIRESGAAISVDLDRLPVVHGDREQLVSVFQNLISNAIKYRSPVRPVRIAVTADSDDGYWRLSVTDNGIGIEPQYFDRIFRIFQRLHSRAEYDGTGIGLAMCKRIVERHGGQIWVQSVPEEGSTFYFTLQAVPPTQSET
ncbi:hypothetical protein A6A05_07385 [Magnetospirillum moscoviense]|uniref:histidine kinase n=1 Tax=Magnetospirillum moscoviense TaxID=1437059 RepID=A0A178MXX7_9PROT|nr:hypothetical protein A6A05_07385 [Magnetospirillum moscoviense]